MEAFVWRAVIEQLRTRYKSPYLETRKNIKKAFATNIRAIEHTGLRGLRAGTDEFETTLSPFLAKWQDNLPDYVPKLLSVGRNERGVEVVIFIDNVDQLSPAYQAQIFLLSQRITRSIGCITIVTLREESYYAANTQRTLTAYTNRKFHIASPRFRRLIDSRVQFALQSLEDEEARGLITPEGIDFDATSIATFLKIVVSSIFEQNHNIARFVESLCFGNMRMALGMFTTFLVSGATDVDKMLAIYSREGAYFVAFHEFVRSIMLGDRKYYKESESPVVNLYDCGADRNSSHFTGLRILAFLLSRRGQTSREGQGYCDVGGVVTLFEDVFGNREDVVRTFNRLLYRQLIEANTRSTDSIAGASHVRVTSAGWYYSKFLAGLFAYLDLVLQDTPIDDFKVEKALRDSVSKVDNLADREAEKVDRMSARFERVSRFLEYLHEQEELEHKDRDLARLGGMVGTRFVPTLRRKFEKERNWIARRLRENREKLSDDFTIATMGDFATNVADQGAPIREGGRRRWLAHRRRVVDEPGACRHGRAAQQLVAAVEAPAVVLRARDDDSGDDQGDALHGLLPASDAVRRFPAACDHGPRRRRPAAAGCRSGCRARAATPAPSQSRPPRWLSVRMRSMVAPVVVVIVVSLPLKLAVWDVWGRRRGDGTAACGRPRLSGSRPGPSWGAALGLTPPSRRISVDARRGP